MTEEVQPVPAYGSTWKMYFADPEDTPSPEDLVEILGAVKVEKHYEASVPSLITPQISNEQ